MNKRVNLLVLGCFLGLILTSCGDPIVGTWIESSEGTTDTVGFTLEKDGVMVPINMGYLEYKSWEKLDNKLVMKGHILSSENPRDFSDTMNIVTLSKKELVLEQGGYTLNYSKE